MHLLRLMLCELQKKKMRDYKKRSCPVIIIKKMRERSNKVQLFLLFFTSLL